MYGSVGNGVGTGSKYYGDLESQRELNDEPQTGRGIFLAILIFFTAAGAWTFFGFGLNLLQ